MLNLFCWKAAAQSSDDEVLTEAMIDSKLGDAMYRKWIGCGWKQG